MNYSHQPLSVFGSFGFGNIGDEAVLPSLSNLLRAAGHETPIQALTRFDHGVVPEISYMETAAEMASSKTIGESVFLVGGGIIEPNPFSCINRLASLRRSPADFRIQPFAISCEPGVSFGYGERRRLSKILDDVPEVLVRDEISEATLRKILPQKPIRSVGDIVLWLESEEPPENVVRDLPERYVVVSLASVWDDRSFWDWLVNELRQIHKQRDVHFLLVPISNAVGKDVEQHKNLLKRLQEENIPSGLCLLGNNPVPKAQWVAALYERAELVISSRLHGCVMAFSQRTPFVGIGYHHKLLGFARTVGWEHAVVPNTLPLRQSKITYGFTIPDLALKQGMLATAAQESLANENYSARDFYRMKQVNEIRRILTSLHHENVDRIPASGNRWRIADR